MDYQSNSHKQKEPNPAKDKTEKKVVKVVKGDVVQKQKPLGRRFKETFFGGEAKVAMAFVVADVLLPTLRDLVFNSVSKGAERYIYGESRFRTRTPTFGSRVQYNNPIYRPDPRTTTYSTTANLPDQPAGRPQSKQFQDIILAARGDAEAVLEMLGAIIDQYDFASLGDLYELVGLEAAHTDQKWGWSGLHNAGVRQVREGYLIDLPPLEALE